jgi:tryptophan 2,3-dioxygenase
MGGYLWESFKSSYLDKHDLTIEKIYDDEYPHADAYVVAEALSDYDELFQRFRYHRVQHIQKLDVRRVGHNISEPAWQGHHL